MVNWATKESNRRESKEILKKAGIVFTEHNKGAHLKIGKIDFWPGTGLFRDEEHEGRGINNFIEYLRPRKASVSQADKGGAEPPVKFLTVEQMFDVAKHAKVQGLHGICEALHKEIFK